MRMTACFAFLASALVAPAVLWAASTAAATRVSSAPPVVHLIPHSHCDVGYRANADEYTVLTDQILRSVADSLTVDPSRRFVWVESFFLHAWWQSTTDVYRSRFRRLVETGQLELILGGWVMNDEAASYYAADVDQMTVGHQFVQQTFNVTPSYGWQIDPFGASSFTPYMFKESGFDAMVFNRIPIDVKDQMKQTQSLEFWWTSPPSAPILAHVLDTHYTYPDGFDFEFNDPIQNPPISDLNVANRSQVLVKELLIRAAWYQTPHVLIPWGSDFRYVDGEWVFFNTDQLVKYINAHSEEFGGISVRYSTLGEYFQAIESFIEFFPRFTGGDFFPYQMNAGEPYWSGFFRSIPDQKLHSRATDAAVFAADTLYAAAATAQHSSLRGLLGDLETARSQAAVLQHHDAITGTAWAFVNLDYFDRLANATAIAAHVSSLSLGALLHLPAANSSSFAPVTSESRLSSSAILTVVNPLSFSRAETIKVVVTAPFARVTDAAGKDILSQIQPSFGPASLWDLFIAIDIPAMSTVSLRLELSSQQPFAASQTVSAACHSPALGEPWTLAGSNVTLHFGGSSRMPALAQTSSPGADTVVFAHKLILYKNDRLDTTYVLTLPSQTPEETLDFSRSDVVVCDGPVVATSTAESSKNATVYYRLPKAGDAGFLQSLEAGAIVGPVPDWSNLMGVFSVGSQRPSAMADQASDNITLLTDDNGYMVMDRQVNFSKPVGGQFYPSTSFASVGWDRASFVWGAATGVSSFAPGQLTYMLHRSLGDPFRGMDHVQIDSGMRVYLSNISDSLFAERSRQSYPLQIFASADQPSPFGSATLFMDSSSRLGSVLVQRMQVGREEAGDILLWMRLENLSQSESARASLAEILGRARSSYRACQRMNLTFTTALGGCPSNGVVELGVRQLLSLQLVVS